MKPELPPYVTPSSRHKRGRQRQVGRRRLLALLVSVVLVAVVVMVAFLAAGGKIKAATTSSSAASSLTTSTGLNASMTDSITATRAGGTLVLTAQLAGGNEVPALSSPASGSATLTVAAGGSSVHYVLTVHNITNLTVARLHEGQAGANGGTILTLYGGPGKNGLFSGTLSQGSFTAAGLGGPLKGKAISDLVTLLKAGLLYVNVGSVKHPSGEIRGQLK